MKRNGSENLSSMLLVPMASGVDVQVDVFMSDRDDPANINQVKIASTSTSLEGLDWLSELVMSWRALGGEVIEELARR